MRWRVSVTPSYTSEGGKRPPPLGLGALEAWALLLSEQRYLTQLAERVAGVTLPQAEIQAAVEAAALERVRGLVGGPQGGVASRESAFRWRVLGTAWFNNLQEIQRDRRVDVVTGGIDGGVRARCRA